MSKPFSFDDMDTNWDSAQDDTVWLREVEELADRGAEELYRQIQTSTLNKDNPKITILTPPSGGDSVIILRTFRLTEGTETFRSRGVIGNGDAISSSTPEVIRGSNGRAIVRSRGPEKVWSWVLPLRHGMPFRVYLNSSVQGDLWNRRFVVLDGKVYRVNNRAVYDALSDDYQAGRTLSVPTSELHQVYPSPLRVVPSSEAPFEPLVTPVDPFQPGGMVLPTQYTEEDGDVESATLTFQAGQIWHKRKKLTPTCVAFRIHRVNLTTMEVFGERLGETGKQSQVRRLGIDSLIKDYQLR